MSKLLVYLILASLAVCSGAFAQQDRAVEIERPEADLVLAGTLSLPGGEGPHPAVLMLTGSGGHTRDQVISGLPMFRVIAEDLVRRGIAVLRMDDRGTGASTGPGVRDSTTEQRADDAQAAFEFLLSHGGIDPERAGLLGHSEGTLTASVLAARTPAVRFVAMLAPFAVRGAPLWTRQQGDILRREGQKSEEEIRVIEEALLGMVEHIGTGGNTDEGFYRHGRAACLAWGDPPDQVTPEFVTEAFGDLRQPWYEYFFRTDPKDYLSRVEQPVLALLGGEDWQVPLDLNLPGLVTALLEAGNGRFTIEVLEDEDHFFMKGEGLAPNEHETGKMRVSEAALEVLGNWLVRQAELGNRSGVASMR